tara:strand:+ start:26 stop:445 length:420 start_codon:yes stop_codon:yes gene_type:complete
MDKNYNENWCSKENIDIVIQETNCSVDTAKEALLFKNGNVIDSIMHVTYGVKCVMEHTNCSLETAKITLLNNNGDVVNSIMEISNNQDSNKNNGESKVNNNHGIKRKFDELSSMNNDDPKVNKERKTTGSLQKLVDFLG